MSGPCPVFVSFTLDICLTTEEKARKNLSEGKKNLSQVKKNFSQSTAYILPKHPHITKPSQTHTLQNTHKHTHTFTAHTTVFTASDICHTVTDDGWRYHPKRVKQFPDINQPCKIASCWIYFGVYLQCTDP